MRLPKPVTIDFETFKIESRPDYPPEPVGVAIKYKGKRARYYAWGHPTENNCTRAEGMKALREAWAYAKVEGALFQNGKFDCAVAEEKCGLKPLPWDKIHDTMFLLFLDDPNQPELGLKPAAARLLGMPPSEQDAVADWLIEHAHLVPGGKISRAKGSDHYFGAYIAYAPGKLVGAYGEGDVIRTEKLFYLLYPKTVDRGMLNSYDRDRQLMPILMEMEREGLPTDHNRLRHDVDYYQGLLVRLTEWVRKRLRAGPDLNVDSGDQLVAAMVAARKVDTGLMPKTKTGKVSSAKASLLLGVKDKQLLSVLKFRTELDTSLGFMEPWLAMAGRSDGYIFTNWNQVKAPKGGDTQGARTGRLSASWFMNMPKEFKSVFYSEKLEKLIRPTGRDLEAFRKLLSRPAGLEDIRELPHVRGYVTHSVNCSSNNILADKDWSQQELRILAHFDGGELLQRYQADPWIDVHDFAKAELEKRGLFYDRKPVKNTNLGLIYGMGVGKLAFKNDMEVEEAKKLKQAVLALYPGLKAMYREMRRKALSNEPFRTWGGREYYCEPPKIIDGRIMEFDYKMVNGLIQGSGADCNKEAVIRFHKAKKPEWNLLLDVHDELTANGPAKDVHELMACLKESMESVEFEVPMLTEGAVSFTNWNALEDYDTKGKIVWTPPKKRKTK